MRQIDADELVSKINKLDVFYFTGETDIAVHDCQMVELGAVLAEIDDAPTVEVELVHGEWTMVIDENDCECIECPLCGEQFYDGDNDTFDKPYNYCPNCGAKMDEGEEV